VRLGSEMEHLGRWFGMRLNGANNRIRVPDGSFSPAAHSCSRRPCCATGFVAGAAGPPSVGLGTATSFSVLAGPGITNTGPSVISGNIGSYPTTTIAGFPDW